MKGMLQRKQQFLQSGTLKVDQKKQMEELEKKQKLKDEEMDEKDSQDLGDDGSKIDPKEVR